MRGPTPRWIASALAWTLIVIAIILFVPSPVEAPPCAHMVEPPVDCLDVMRAENDAIWWTHTLPLLLVIASGYLLVVVLAIRDRRDREPA